jgi:hypothetical protein
MFEDETFGAANLDTGTTEVPSTTFVQIHNLGEAEGIDTGASTVVSVDFTQGHTLAPEGPTDTGEPEIDRTVIVGDHYFALEELLASGHVLSTAFFNPALAREVNADNKKIGNRATFAGGNKTKFARTAGNRVKVG